MLSHSIVPVSLTTNFVPETVTDWPGVTEAVLTVTLGPAASVAMNGKTSGGNEEEDGQGRQPIAQATWAGAAGPPLVGPDLGGPVSRFGDLDVSHDRALSGVTRVDAGR